MLFIELSLVKYSGRAHLSPGLPLVFFLFDWLNKSRLKTAQSAVTVEYTDCMFAEGKTLPQWVSWKMEYQWLGVTVPEKVLSMGQIGQSANKWLMLNRIVWNRTVCSFNYVQTNDWYLNEFLVMHSNTWNHLTICQRMSLGLLKNVINKMYLQIIYIQYICIKRIWH